MGKDRSYMTYKTYPWAAAKELAESGKCDGAAIGDADQSLR